VQTPLFRLAEVLSYSKDGAVELRYVGLDPNDLVRLVNPALLKAPDR
jgi:hypothetical protein